MGQDRGRPGPSCQGWNRLFLFGNLRGLVVGAWGEASRDLHALVKLLAESRVAARSRARGYEVGDGEYSFVVGQVRRVLSCSFV